MRKNRKGWVWFFTVLPLLFLLYSYNALGDMNSLLSLESDYGLLSEVCGPDSNGVAEAPIYIGESPHPVILLDSQKADKHEWNDGLASTWQPESISTTQLVGCVEEEWKLIQICNYTFGRQVQRYRHNLTIHLHKAHNGKKIRSQKFLGGFPAYCQRVEVFWTWEYVKVKRGSPVSFEEAEIWLFDYVNAVIPAVKSMPWIPLLLTDD